MNGKGKILVSSVLLLGLATTGAASYWVESNTKRYEYLKFIQESKEIEQKIKARLDAHEQTLLSGSAFFESSTEVTRDDFKIYATWLLKNEHFNGIQALGFAKWIKPEQLDAHKKAIRKTGFPNYEIKPHGQRDAYTSIIYIEPFEGRNLRAFGYDMYSEPVRHTAMAMARDENQVTLSGKVILVQETDQDVQAGTLMYSPIYENNKPLDTVEQRQNAIFGWIYSPFRMTDLLHNIVGNSTLHLHIYDGDSVEPENLLYQHAEDLLTVIFFEQRRVVFNGRVWTLYFEESAPWNSSHTWITATVGIVISLLFFLFLRAYLMVQNREARLIIQHAAQELINQELLFHKAANEELLRQNLEKEKRAAELALANDAKEALRLQVNQMQKIESIGRLTSGISHDFNNILACMLGYNELNKYISAEMTNETLCEELKYNTKQVDIAGQRAVTLIKKMMAYSRQEAKKEGMNVKPTPEVIAEVVTMLQPALTSQIKLEVALHCDDTVQIDVMDLHQILTNLAVNARDAMKKHGGVITISLNKVMNLKAQCVACAETLEGDFIELSLSDNGTGIEPPTIIRMFDPFFTTKQVGEGTGLGLSTVSGMVHHSHGHILVDSTLGQGTAFRLLFPPAVLG